MSARDENGHGAFYTRRTPRLRSVSAVTTHVHRLSYRAASPAKPGPSSPENNFVMIPAATQAQIERIVRRALQRTARAEPSFSYGGTSGPPRRSPPPGGNRKPAKTKTSPRTSPRQSPGHRAQTTQHCRRGYRGSCLPARWLTLGPDCGVAPGGTLSRQESRVQPFSWVPFREND